MEKEQFNKIIENQIILDKKLDQIINELSLVKKDLNRTINNQLLLEEYNLEIIDHLKKIIVVR